MAKGTKTASDAPAFRMRVTRNGLEPVTAMDAERLDSYRLGSEIWVHPTQEINRELRKFWAVLNKVIKECKTPWRNSTQAADSLKLSLGHAHQFKDQTGRWLRAPKSLTEFDLPEMAEFNRLAFGVLFEITGVDPLTMQAEAPMHDAAQTPLEPEADSMDAKADNMDGGETINQSTGEITEQSNQPDPDEVKNLLRECAMKLWALTTDHQTPINDRRGSLELAVPSWKAELPTKLDAVRNIVMTTDRVITGKITPEAGRTMISGFAGIEEGLLK